MNHTTKKTQYTLPDGSIAYFSRYKFKCAIHSATSTANKKMSKQDFLEDMADATGNSVSAIKHWLAGHNAPSDLEKLKAIADYLNTELIDLLETETENAAMTNTTTPIKVVDFSETKNTVRDLYIRITDYIELYRIININNMYAQVLANEFPKIYTAIMHTRFDLPKDTFDKITGFAVNYLQQMYTFLQYYERNDDPGYLSDHAGKPDEVLNDYYTGEESGYNFFDLPWFDNLYVSTDENSEDCLLFNKAVSAKLDMEQQEEFWELPDES